MAYGDLYTVYRKEGRYAWEQTGHNFSSKSDAYGQIAVWKRSDRRDLPPYPKYKIVKLKSNTGVKTRKAPIMAARRKTTVRRKHKAVVSSFNRKRRARRKSVKKSKNPGGVKMRKAPKGWMKAKAVRVVRRGGKRIVEVRR
jgi:hypothetical protein